VKPITIIGGGLAGLTLGILLRRENIPVTLHEASRYPRHRVCGEFLSGAGRRIFQEILNGNLQTLDAKTVSLAVGDRAIRLGLRDPALCCSRYEIDATLAQKFAALGGELRTNSRITLENQAGTVHATGRRRAETGHGHLFGLKAHAANVSIAADLELHFHPNRYVGICRLPGDQVNVCGLFYFDGPLPNLQERWPEILASEIPALKGVNFLPESFCAVAGISLDKTPPDDRFVIGDAAAMIPPLTGNGMSMAFESAALATPPLIAYAREKISWEEALSAQQKAWRAAFANRLRWAGFLQRFVFQKRGQNCLFAFSKVFPLLPKFLLSHTR
jgi:menaquinone-9 beta-reductase